MLSPEVAARLERARAGEKDYRPNDAIASQLAEKTLVMFVAPVAVGKSFLMNHVAGADGEFSRVPVFTTREPRPDDEPGMFRYVPHDDEHVGALLEKIENGEVVQYAIHPTSGRIYGSEMTDYPNKYNMLAMLSGGVEQLQRIPFRGTVVIGVAVRPEIWQQRLRQRYPTESGEKAGRLREAQLSLDWLLSHDGMKWIDNTDTNPAQAVQDIINIVKYNQKGSGDTTEYARKMRASIRP